MVIELAETPEQYEVGYAPACNSCPFKQFFSLTQQNKVLQAQNQRNSQELSDIKKKLDKFIEKEKLS